MASLESAPRIGRSRWYMPTPGKFVALLLLSVVALYLSDQYDWFAFNKPKGWTVLIAVTSITAGLVLIGVWTALAYLVGRRAQFGLLPLLLMVPTVAVPFAWLGREMQQAKQLAENIKRFEEGGGITEFVDMFLTNRNLVFVDGFANTPQWLRQFFGDEFFADIAWVLIKDSKSLSQLRSLGKIRSLDASRELCITDQDLDTLALLPDLERVSLSNTNITDAGLIKIQQIPTLKSVWISESNASEAGCAAFEKSLAGRCEVRVSPRFNWPEDFEFAIENPADPHSPETLTEGTTEDLAAEWKEVEKTE